MAKATKSSLKLQVNSLQAGLVDSENRWEEMRQHWEYERDRANTLGRELMEAQAANMKLMHLIHATSAEGIREHVVTAMEEIEASRPAPTKWNPTKECDQIIFSAVLMGESCRNAGAKFGIRSGRTLQIVHAAASSANPAVYARLGGAKTQLRDLREHKDLFLKP